jgi:hypothetical protein
VLGRRGGGRIKVDVLVAFEKVSMTGFLWIERKTEHPSSFARDIHK